MKRLHSVVLLLALCGCGANPAAPMNADMALPPTSPIAADPQRTGDPQAGYTALLNNDYIGCGLPYDVFTQYIGPASASDQLPGRTGDNATLPYWFTAFTVKSGVEVVSANCLVCHAGRINGQLVIGLGAADGDFTNDVSIEADLAGGFVKDPTEHVEWAKWADRMDAIGPYTRTLTVGVNPADNLAAVLFAHRDPKTLAWSDTPSIELPPARVVPVDVPPWWRMKKKNAMFYDGAGRGDHARIMMTASTLCTDSVADAQRIDSFFADIEAYILSLTPPAWPFGAIDPTLAAQGETVYEDNCARCHGTYGPRGRFPNLLVSLSEVQTDELLASGAAQFAGPFVDWFNASFYGQSARLEPLPGYVAPPLDGIWATAPYLHNGSVPTLAALLNSTARPKYWTRTFDSTDYDQKDVGWNFTVLDHGQAAEPTASKKKLIYDTTQPGYGNGGHTYGDALSESDRSALLEYLKTL